VPQNDMNSIQNAYKAEEEGKMMKVKEDKGKR
jgi:hypothetical protein